MRGTWILLSCFLFSLVWLGCAPTMPEVSLQDDAVPTETAALSAWVAEREAAFDDIRPGDERFIIRNQPGKSKISIVYFHGFSASRQEISPVCEEVADRLRANVYFTRLTGHGRSDDAMAEATVEDWMKDAIEAMTIGRLLGEQVVIISTSTGGSLAAWLAAQQPEGLAGLVFVSPNFGPKDKTANLLLWPGRDLLLNAVIGEYREWEPSNEQVAEHWTYRYPASALVTMMELVYHATHASLESIHQPTLVFYSPDDQVLDPGLIEDYASKIGGKPLEIVSVPSSGDESNHVIAGNILSPKNNEMFIDKITNFLEANILKL